jgi:hypothetical protein
MNDFTIFRVRDVSISARDCPLMMSHVPTTSLDRMTVNAGAVLFTVSVKLTSMYFRATSPRKTVVNLSGKKETKINSS